MNKILSIIVPSYNMEAYLPKCLESLIIDDIELFHKLDVIVVNDGSKDRTSEIAHNFEKKYAGIFRVIDKENGHYGSCINIALTKAEGLFIKILDADDSFNTKEFKRFITFLMDIPSDVDMVLTDYEFIDNLGRIIYNKYPFGDGEVFKPEKLVSSNCKIAMHAVCYRTKLLHEIHYFQTEGIAYTDTEWIFLPPAFSRNICYFQLCIYKYLIDRQGQSMDPRIRSKAYKTIRLLAKSMIDKYHFAQKSTSYFLPYLEWQLSIHFKRFFVILLDLPFLNNTVSSFALFKHSRFRFNYLEFILRNSYSTRIILSLLRIYNSLFCKVKSTNTI